MQTFIIKQYKNDAILIENDTKFSVFLKNFEQKLIDWKCYSLVAKSTLSDIYNWHFIEALSIVNLLNDYKDGLEIIDFGAGGGVIGLCLSAYGFDNVKLIERSANKIFFIKNIMKYENVFNSYNSYKKALVIVRGVTTIKLLLDILFPVCKLILFKSFSVQNEINEALSFYNFEYIFYARIGNARGFIVFLENIIKIK